MSKSELHQMLRLFVEGDLASGATISPSAEQTHYLRNVMRLQPGNALRLFNGRDGEWRGEIAAGKAKLAVVNVGAQLKPQTTEPDLWLCCAPIKKTHFDNMIEKATELGVSVIQPVLTNRTQIREVNESRARAIAIEAAEQSERLSVPDFRPPLPLRELVENWLEDHALIVCAEWGDAVPVGEAFAKHNACNKTALLTGPEGGFVKEELEMLRKIKGVNFIRLGPRILRADTAAIAALSVWQAMRGDWK